MAYNVHSKVRAVMNRADKIKPKDFFLNKIFRLHLEDMATNITKRYRGSRKVKVVVDWDTKDGATVASTNNLNVYLNAGTKFLHTTDLKLLYERVLGLFAHELGHILWTDFVANFSYNNGIERGVWFPRKPRLVSYDMQIAEQDFWDLALQSAETKALLIKYINELNNILEDGFIEEQIFRTYPGVLGIGLKKTRDAHWEDMPELSRMIAEEDEVDEDINKHKLFTMFAILLQYAKYGEVKCDGVPFTDEHLVMLGRLMPLVDEFMQSPPRERFALTSEVALIIFPWLKDFIEKFLEQDNQSGTGSGSGSSGQSQLSPSQANALSNMLQQNVQGMSGNSQQAQGNSNAVAPVQSNANSNTQTSQNRQKTQSQIPTSNEFQGVPTSSGGSGNEDGGEENGSGGSGSGNIPDKDEEPGNEENGAGSGLDEDEEPGEEEDGTGAGSGSDEDEEPG
ncbi:MAG: hypothetical protein UGF89_09580, partial [Acutalibacteraceae bacterium]|nr:hypothetical protein [Acutalibacteraceae bacterium]